MGDIRDKILHALVRSQVAGCRDKAKPRPSGYDVLSHSTVANQPTNQPTNEKNKH